MVGVSGAEEGGAGSRTGFKSHVHQVRSPSFKEHATTRTLPHQEVLSQKAALTICPSQQSDL